MHNPDPKKFVIRVRRGKAILVDRQILRWRKKRKKELAAKNVDKVAESGHVKEDVYTRETLLDRFFTRDDE